MELPPKDLWELERESMAAWPTMVETPLGEWHLRFARHAFGRSHAVQTLGDPGMALADAIAVCEKSFGPSDLPVKFRIPELGDWVAIDALLVERGYDEEDRTEVWITDLPDATADPAVILSEAPDHDWFELTLGHPATGSDREEAKFEIYRRLPAPCRFASLSVDGMVVSVGCGNVHNGTLWIFGMATRPEFRRQGLGSRVAASLLAWARTEGAHRAALQVVEGNAPAQALYRKLGYRYVYRYHYRQLNRPTT